jgi:hypothetical protein
MAINLVVAVTDGDWFEMLRHRFGCCLNMNSWRSTSTGEVSM